MRCLPEDKDSKKRTFREDRTERKGRGEGKHPRSPQGWPQVGHMGVWGSYRGEARMAGMRDGCEGTLSGLFLAGERSEPVDFIKIKVRRMEDRPQDWV